MDVLYHYCSTTSFHAIAQSRSLWLSSLSLANDTMEGRLVTQVIARLAERDSLDQALVQRLQDAIGVFEKIIDGLGFCLSEDRDLLSQWRGYAADATGVAIGFSVDYLTWLSKQNQGRKEAGFSLQQVEYESTAQELTVEPTYRQIRQFIDAGAFKMPGSWGLLDIRTDEEIESENAKIIAAHSKLSTVLLSLFPELFRLKMHAFREEREWRLLSYLVKNGGDSCSYRATSDRIVPYRKFELLELERHPLVEVILGPKHGTPSRLVEDFLRQSGFGPVQVTRSEASYR